MLFAEDVKMCVNDNIFDRELFNRLYYRWFSGVYVKYPKLAEELDKKIIPEMGKIVAQRIRHNYPGNYNIDYLIEALKRSHWGQEKVEVFEKNKDFVVLGVQNCSFQKHWIKRFGNSYNCNISHKNFLVKFCNEIIPCNIENLMQYGLQCKWKINIVVS